MNPFSASRERIDLIRQQLGISRWKNIAIADLEIGNEQDSLVGISGQVTRTGTVGLPNSPMFQTFEVWRTIYSLAEMKFFSTSKRRRAT